MRVGEQPVGNHQVGHSAKPGNDGFDVQLAIYNLQIGRHRMKCEPPPPVQSTPYFFSAFLSNFNPKPGFIGGEIMPSFITGTSS